MKLAVLMWVLVFSVIATGCSVHHVSGDYACTAQSDCQNGRVCTDGYCVVPGTPPVIDAPKIKKDAPGQPPPDARVCPPQCSSCDFGNKECKIDCAVTNCTNGSAIVCPPGFNCDVLCTTPSSCRSGVNCNGTLSCHVTCSGGNACRGVACGAGPCNVACTGPNSCRGIQCGASCACDVACANNALCAEVACTAVQCDSLSGGCSSNPTGCDTCP